MEMEKTTMAHTDLVSNLAVTKTGHDHQERRPGTRSLEERNK